jgi:PAS domain S-box-containing protein
MILLIGLPTMVIYLGAMWWFLSNARGWAYEKGQDNMADRAETAAARFDDYITKAARVADTTSRFLTQIPALSEDQVYGILRDNVRANNRVFGSAVAYEPGMMRSGDALFCPYVHKAGEDVQEMNIDASVYNWYEDEEWEWWHLPKNRGEGAWTSPYLDKGAGHILMTSYGVPFYRTGPEGGEKQFRGVTTVDIDLVALREDIGKNIMQGHEFLIFTSAGQYVYSAKSEQIKKQTIYDTLAERDGGSELKGAVEQLLSEKSGVLVTDGLFGDERKIIAYAEIPSTGWVFVTYLKEVDALAEYRRNMPQVIAAFVAALVLILIVIYLASGRLARPIGVLHGKVLQIADGEAGVEVDDLQTGDEIETLAQAFGTMQGRVADREEKLEHARETTLRELLESVPDAMIVVDREGRIRRINPQVERLFGYGHGELTGESVEKLLPDRRWAEFGRGSGREQGASEQTLELIGRTRNGSEIPVEIGLSPFHEPEGIMTVVAIRDITDRRRYERQLEEARDVAESANRSKSEFLSHMSHEFRTPLNGILGYAQILERDPDATVHQKDSLEAIIGCGDHLLALINDVLDLSKIEAGRLEVDVASCDLHRLVKDVGGIVQHRAAGKRVSFEVDVSPEVPRMVLTDAPKLRQILVNLLGNAVKFTEIGGVTLRLAERPKGHLAFEVIDTGVGMPGEDLEDIFDPFKQVEAGKAAGGTGLGLAITKRLAEGLGGGVTVRSVAGEGSVFTVTLPLTEATEDETPVMEDAAELGAGNLILGPDQKVTILVADDSKTNRDILEQMLEMVGFGVLLADDGDTALEVLRGEQPIDLVLMDVRMPRLNGIEAVRAIRADATLAKSTVIAVTASVFPEFREKALRAGFDDFLAKPFRIDALMSLIKKYLDVVLVEEDGGEEDDPPAVAAVVAAADFTVPSALLARLQAALKIRSLTTLKAGVDELGGVPGAEQVAEEMNLMVRRFDFQGLADKIVALEKQ